MKTKLHFYNFNLDKPDDKSGYEEMLKVIEQDGVGGRGHCMHAIGGKSEGFSKPNGTIKEVDIDPTCLFDNQWNETKESGNRRLFDWFLEAIFYNGRENRRVKRGHWLEITPEMVKARQECRKCGYCGKHYGPLHDPVPGDFCEACLDSDWLKEKDLHLLRLLPLAGSQDRSRLTDDEKALLMPKYVARQTTGAGSRAVQKREKERKSVLEKYERETAAATTERDGMLWLFDHGFSLGNVIYYSHTNRFGFGWRSPVGDEVLTKILDVISEFPFLYTIKTADGRTLQNEE